MSDEELHRAVADTAASAPIRRATALARTLGVHIEAGGRFPFHLGSCSQGIMLGLVFASRHPEQAARWYAEIAAEAKVARDKISSTDEEEVGFVGVLADRFAKSMR